MAETKQKRGINKSSAHLSLSKEQQDNYVKQIKQKFSSFDPPGTVNLWQLPNAMQEDQLVGFMSQFGTVYKVKVIRSTRTGRPKGVAYIQFQSCEVAKIVASTMNNYLTAGGPIRCKYIENPPPKIFQQSTFQLKAKHKKENKKHDKSRSDVQSATMLFNLYKRQMKTMRKLKDMGIDYSFKMLENGPSQIQKEFGVLKAKTDKKSQTKRSSQDNGTAPKSKRAKLEPTIALESDGEEEEEEDEMSSLDLSDDLDMEEEMSSDEEESDDDDFLDDEASEGEESEEESGEDQGSDELESGDDDDDDSMVAASDEDSDEEDFHDSLSTSMYQEAVSFIRNEDSEEEVDFKSPEKKTPKGTPKQIVKTPKSALKKTPSGKTPKTAKTPIQQTKTPSQTPKAKTPKVKTPKAVATPLATPKVLNTPTVQKTPKAQKTPKSNGNVPKTPKGTPIIGKTLNDTPKVGKTPKSTPKVGKTPKSTPKVGKTPKGTPKAWKTPKGTPKV